MFENFFAFTETSIHWIDVSLIIAYMAGITIFGYFFSKRIKTSSDYFLAGRSLPWWIIGMSIIGTNIGSNDYVGAAGGAYRIGIAQANFEWIGAIPAMVLSAFIFIPFYWRAGVFSIPEYLGKRYSDAVRVISAIILTLFSIIIVGVFLWATSLMLKTYLGWPIPFSILVTATVVGFYTISGGLGAVAITDSIQLVIMFTGAIAVAILGISEAGGLEHFINTIQAEHPSHLKAFLPSDHEFFPWPGVILGLGMVLSPAYWCTNQAILQRTLGARSEWDGRASMMLAAIAKTFVPFLIVLPGLLALTMIPGGLDNQDQALPWVIKNILPVGLSGLMFVAFIAALQSSIDSTMISASVMITRDIIGVVTGRGVDELRDLKLGKIFTFMVLIIGIFCAPLTAKFEGIYVFVQFALSLFQGPMLALILMGILSKKMTPKAGLWSLVIGVASALLMGLPSLLGNLGFTGAAQAAGGWDINMLYIAFWSFIISIVSLVTISRFTEPKTEKELENLTYSKTVPGVHTND